MPVQYIKAKPCSEKCTFCTKAPFNEHSSKSCYQLVWWFLIRIILKHFPTDSYVKFVV